MTKWFNKFINCSFYLDNELTGGKEGEYIFMGACEHSYHDNKRDALQYEFCAENKPIILLSYKEARRIMGPMIDRYNK